MNKYNNRNYLLQQHGLLNLYQKKKRLYLSGEIIKIRHYGILGNRNKKLKFKRCIELCRVKPKEFENLSSVELFFKLTEIKIGKCKNCEKGNLIKIGKLMPRSDSPP